MPEPRIPLVAIPPEVEARLAELGGRPINLYHCLASNPAMLRAWVEFAWAIRNQCTTPRRLRELMIVRGAQICRSEYELTHHSAMALAAGVSADELEALEGWRQSSLFSAAERAALALMEGVVALSVSDEVSAELSRHFSDAERVELTMTAGAYSMVPRLLDALAVPLEEARGSTQER